MGRRVSVVELQMKKNNWSFDRKLIVTFAVAVATACGGFTAADNYGERRATTQRVLAAETPSAVR